MLNQDNNVNFKIKQYLLSLHKSFYDSLTLLTEKTTK